MIKEILIEKEALDNGEFGYSFRYNGKRFAQKLAVEADESFIQSARKTISIEEHGYVNKFFMHTLKFNIENIDHEQI